MSDAFKNKWLPHVKSTIGLQSHIQAVQYLTGANKDQILTSAGFSGKKWDTTLALAGKDKLLKILYATYQSTGKNAKYPFDGMKTETKLAQLDTQASSGSAPPAPAPSASAPPPASAPPAPAPSGDSFVVAVRK